MMKLIKVRLFLLKSIRSYGKLFSVHLTYFWDFCIWFLSLFLQSPLDMLFCFACFLHGLILCKHVLK